VNGPGLINYQSFTQSGGALTSTLETHNGYFTHSGGINIVTGDFRLQTGTYNLSGSGSLLAQNQHIGWGGIGTFNQSGGSNAVNGDLYVGKGSTGNGIYNLSGSGSLSAQNQYIGEAGSGTFTHSGGSNTVSGGLYLGKESTGTGTYNLSDSGSLLAPSQYIGFDGAGTFKQTGGSNTVTNTLTIAANLGSSGTYKLESGDLNAGTIAVNPGGAFQQSGGTLSGNLENRGTFIYQGGTFNGRLFLYNMPYINTSTFTAGDGLANYTAFSLGPGITFILNGQGLDNRGILSLAGGTLGGSGPLVNNSYFSGYGTIDGSGEGLTNNGWFLLVGGNLDLNNTGTNTNYANMDLALGKQLNLGSGVTLDNRGSLNLNNGTMGGSGTLENREEGVISGQGTISSNFTNRGLLTVQHGITTVTNPAVNYGAIQISGSTATLAGGVIDNRGTMEGYGTVANNISNTGRIEALYSTLNLNGNVVNNVGGLMTAMSGRLFIEQGLAGNAGQIILAGGAFDNNNKPMTNTGQMSGYGSFSTGGLSNSGTMSLTGGPATVNGPVTNETAGQVNITANSTSFTGPVINYGTVKNTNATVTWAGSFTNSGAYISDPGTQNHIDLKITSDGYLQGGLGDKWSLSGNFQNESAQNTQWNTALSDLAFTGGGTHQLYIPGSDKGGSLTGYSENFAWGSLDLIGQVLNLMDGNATLGGALYLGEILGITLDKDGKVVTDIFGNGLNIYYDPNLLGNSYLGGITYDLSGDLGGKLIPTPLPASAWLFLSGLVGLGLLGRRKRIKLGGKK